MQNPCPKHTDLIEHSSSSVTRRLTTARMFKLTEPRREFVKRRAQISLQLQLWLHFPSWNLGARAADAESQITTDARCISVCFCRLVGF